MAYREEEQVRLRRLSSKQAVTLAMQGKWKEAIAANQSLLESFPNDVDAFNRLGRAYLELGEYAQSKEAYAKALELDPYNTIARKNLDRLAHLGETTVGAADASPNVEPHHFIEETGKAGVVRLTQLAPEKVVAKMVSGDKLQLKPGNGKLNVENTLGEYIGQVETRHSQRLIKLMEGGNQYSAALISATPDTVTVIVRETYQHPSQAGKFSFPPRALDRSRTLLGGDRFIKREHHDDELEEELEYASGGGEEGEFNPEESMDMMDRPEEE